MALLVIAILAIAGLTTTIGLLIFHILALISKKCELLPKVAVSALAAFVIVINISLLHTSALDNLFKHFIFYSILTNYILTVAFLRKIYREKDEYFPLNDRLRKRSNVLALVLYGLVSIIFLYFSVHGLYVGWQEIMS